MRPRAPRGTCLFALYGREKTGRDVIEWVQRGVELGAGEVLLTSVDREGTRKGFDIDLIKAVSAAVSVPVIASGGMGSADDMVAAAKVGCADAIAMADVLHYGRTTLQQLRQAALDANLAVRKI